MEIICRTLSLEWRGMSPPDEASLTEFIYNGGYADIDILHEGTSLLEGGLLLPLVGTAVSLVSAYADLEASGNASLNLGDTATDLELSAAPGGSVRVAWTVRGSARAAITCSAPELRLAIGRLAVDVDERIMGWAPRLFDEPQLRRFLGELTAEALRLLRDDNPGAVG